MPFQLPSPIMGDQDNESFTCLVKAIVNQIKLTAPVQKKALPNYWRF